MRSNEFVSTEEVIAEASDYLNDTDFTHGVGKSFYELIAHRTIESLALNMFFATTTKDIFNWNECGTGLIDIPRNCFNIKQIYLFNSSCDKKENPCVTDFNPNCYKVINTSQKFSAGQGVYGGVVFNGTFFAVGSPISINDGNLTAIKQHITESIDAGDIFTLIIDDNTLILTSTCVCDVFDTSLTNQLKIQVNGSDPGTLVNFVFESCTDEHVTCPDDSSNCTDTDRCERACCRNRSCWSQFVEAHWKRQFNNFGSTGIKTAKIAPDHRDPVYIREARETGRWGELVYFGIQNGQIGLSDNACSYANMRIVANGFGSDNCELPIIPRELRRVCVDKVKYDACKKIMVVFPEYMQLYAVYKNDLYGDNTVQNPGTWLQAERFIKSLNTKQRNDLFEYFGNIDIK